MELLALFAATFFLGLLAALLGMHAAFQLTAAAPGRRPSIGRLAAICILGSLLMYPALFLAMQFEFHVIEKGNPGAQGGVLAMIIAMGVCGLISMVATLMLMARSR
jgi:hypothetical protein